MNILYANLIDSHFHLQSLEKKGMDSQALLKQMNEYHMAGGIDIGVDCDDLGQRSLLVKDFPFIKQSAGIGPWGVDEGKPSIDAQLEILDHQIDMFGACAIGEIGLDNHWKYGTEALQEELFIKQIEIANKRALPIIIHNRQADLPLGNIIEKTTFAKPGLIHCFQGTLDLALLAIEQGFYISFAGPLTFKKNQGMRDILSEIPLDRLLLETDSPYLCPEPYRGQINTPLMISHIYETAASVKAMSVEELATQIQTNFRAFLS